MQIADMETWIRDNSDRVYGYLIYKRLFTPYEQEQKFTDESQFEDIHFNYGRIVEAIELGNGDWLIGFQELFLEDEEYIASNDIQYHRLSDIKLYSYEWMQRKIQHPDIEHGTETKNNDIVDEPPVLPYGSSLSGTTWISYKQPYYEEYRS